MTSEMTNRFSATSTADDVLAGVNLTGKRFLITGASSGIGLAAARALVAHAASVLGAVRDLAKAEAATAPVRDAAVRSGGDFALIDLDLSSLQNVFACADQLLAAGQRFDAIIAIAGIMTTPLSRTIDGLENQLSTNYLGHFVLITLIEPLITDNVRVVFLSSSCHGSAV